MTELNVRARAEAAMARALLGLPEPVVRRLAGKPIEVDGQRMEPDAQLLLRLRNLASNPAYEELPLADARRTLDEDAAAVRGKLIPVAEVRDLEVAGLRARLYVPELERGGLLVYFHGGGWVLGSLDSHEQPCRFLAREGGVRVLSVDYRLAPEAKFPAAVEDGLAAFAWAREHAGELGIDPGRIGVGGDSAGGNISAVVAHLAEPKPALALLVYPVCDVSKKHESYRLFGEGFFLTERNMDWYRTNYLPDDEAGLDPRASPLLADDLSGLPRTYVVIAGFDALRDEGLAYARRLEDAGVDVELAFHPGLFHGCVNTTGVGRTSAAAMHEAAEVLKTL
jgi:acetyl esterase/lipase